MAPVLSATLTLSSWLPWNLKARRMGQKRAISLIQLPSVDFGTITRCGPVMPLNSCKKPRREIVCSVFPSPCKWQQGSPVRDAWRFPWKLDATCKAQRVPTKCPFRHSVHESDSTVSQDLVFARKRSELMPMEDLSKRMACA